MQFCPRGLQDLTTVWKQRSYLRENFETIFRSRHTNVMEMHILPKHYGWQLPNMDLLELIHSTLVIFSGLVKWCGWNATITVDFQQGLLPLLKIILLTSYSEQEIGIFTSHQLQNLSQQYRHIGHIKCHSRIYLCALYNFDLMPRKTTKMCRKSPSVENREKSSHLDFMAENRVMEK